MLTEEIFIYLMVCMLHAGKEIKDKKKYNGN